MNIADDFSAIHKELHKIEAEKEAVRAEIKSEPEVFADGRWMPFLGSQWTPEQIASMRKAKDFQQANNLTAQNHGLSKRQ